MRQTDKPLRDYQKELNSLERDLYYYSIQLGLDGVEGPAVNKEELARLAKGGKMAILIKSLRGECRQKFGDKSLWPDGQCPAISFSLGLAGGLSKAFHVWGESEYNKIEDLKSTIVGGGFFGDGIDEETGEKT